MPSVAIVGTTKTLTPKSRADPRRPLKPNICRFEGSRGNGHADLRPSINIMNVHSSNNPKVKFRVFYFSRKTQFFVSAKPFNSSPVRWQICDSPSVDFDMGCFMHQDAGAFLNCPCLSDAQCKATCIDVDDVTSTICFC